MSDRDDTQRAQGQQAQAQQAQAQQAQAQQAQHRRSSARLYLALNALLLTSIVFMVNYLAFRHYARWDWTEQSIFTLSDRSEHVLAGLSEPIEVWVLLSESEPEHAELQNLLERYRAATDRIELHYVDPHRDPGGYQQVVQRFHLGMAERATREGVVTTSDVAVVVASGPRQWEIGRDDSVSHSFEPEGGEDTIRLNVEAEQAVTGAILEVTSGRTTTVCFTTGHGELPLEGGAEGLGELAQELRRDNLAHETIQTRGLDAVPESCNAVAVIGPELAFDEAEARLLREYARGGGNLFLALDPIPDPDQRRIEPTGLEDMLRDFGIRLDRDIVVEPDPAFIPAGPGHPIALYLVGDFGQHPITEPFRGAGMGLLVSTARSVRPIGDMAKVLVRASARSYGETDLASLAQGDFGEPDPRDIAGPASLGVATRVEVSEETPGSPEGASEGPSEEQAPTGGRVVVLGDASMLTSELLGQPAAANRAFAGAVLGWVTEREALISIPPRTVDQPGMPSEEDVSNLFFRVVVLIPLAFVFLGIAVWWNRRL